MKIVNLASRPFKNRRPVRRLAAILWLVGGTLALFDLWLFWDHLTGFSTTSDQLAEVRTGARRETENIEQLGQEIAELALDEQNDEVAVLNRLIADRTFPWSLLFDRLESVLPEQVWLKSVRPEREEAFEGRSASRRSGDRRRARRRGADAGSGVRLAMTGQARDSEALRQLVDRLFADPAFKRPNLHNQAMPNNRLVDWNLDVTFQVDVALALAREAMAGSEPQVASEAGAPPDAVRAETGGPVPPAAETLAGTGDAADRSPAPAPPATTRPPPPDRAPPTERRSLAARDRPPAAVGRQNPRPVVRSRGTRANGEGATPEDDEDAPVVDPISAGGVPIIVAPTLLPTDRDTATPVPATPVPPPPAARREPPPPAADRGRPPPPPERGPRAPDADEPVPPPPPTLTEDDLEPLPPSSPASSSARIGGGG